MVLALTGTVPAWADPVADGERVERREAAPKRLEGVDVVERLGEAVPLDLVFNDEAGHPIALREIVDGSVPVIFTLNYSDCPMLCSLQLDGFVKALAAMDFSAGREFRIVTVSLNPDEQPRRAADTKGKYLARYGRPGTEAGWRFLTGSSNNIGALAAALGIQYGYNEQRDEYVHPALVTLVTPDGRVGRYLYGIEYHPKTLRLSLTEVSKGKIGSTVDRLVLYCFHYDEKEGRYAPAARNLMKLGGAATVVLVGGMLLSFFVAERRRKGKPTT